MDTELEPHRPKRRYSDDLFDSSGNNAESSKTILESHESLVTVMDDSGGLDHSGDNIGTVDDDTLTEAKLETADTAKAGSYNTLSGASDASIRRSSQSSLSPLENTTSRNSYDTQEYRRRPSYNDFLPDLPRLGREVLSLADHQTSSHSERHTLRTNQPPETLNLCDAIAHFLAAFSKQEPSPFRTSPSRTQDIALDRDRSLSNRNSTTDISTPDRQSTTDQLDMPGIVSTTSLDTAVPMVADHKSLSGIKKWEVHKGRFTNMLMRLLGWKNEFNKGDLQALLGGTLTTATAAEQAVKARLLSIGEKLSDLVEYQMEKSRMNERLSNTARELDDWVQKGKEAQCDSRSRDEASSIVSDSTIVSGIELVHAVDQQLDELDSDLDHLIGLDIPGLLKKPVPRRRSRQRKIHPSFKHWNHTPHAYDGQLSTITTPINFPPSLSTIVRPRPPPSHSLFPEPEYTVKTRTAMRASKIRKTKETDQLASTLETLQRLRWHWRHTRPPPGFEHLNKSSQLTFVISSDPTVFQVDKFQATLARFEQSQRGPTDSIDSLTALFSNFRIRPIDDRLCIDIVQIFRDSAPTVHHEPISETTGPLLKSAQSTDFTLALLESLPHWLLYTNFPDSKQLAEALSISVQTVLLDEFWDSCVSLLSQVRESSLSPDCGTDPEPAKRRYVQNLLLERIKRLDSLQVNRALMSTWDNLQPMVNDLLFELRNCAADMPMFETETERQFIGPHIPSSPTVSLHPAFPPPPMIQPLQHQFGPHFRYKDLRRPSYRDERLTNPLTIQHEQWSWVLQRGSLDQFQQCPEPPMYDQNIDGPTSSPIIRRKDSLERPRSPGSTSTFHVPNDVVPTIEVPSTVLLPPAHLLCYAVPAPENGPVRSVSLPRRGSSTSTGSVDEETTELGTTMRTIHIGEEFVNYTNTKIRRNLSFRQPYGHRESYI